MCEMKKLQELDTGSERERTLLARCRDSIRSIDPSVEIILYGSRARGDANAESDYDLLILTDGDATLKREDTFRRKLFPMELVTGAGDPSLSIIAIC